MRGSLSPARASGAEPGLRGARAADRRQPDAGDARGRVRRGRDRCALPLARGGTGCARSRRRRRACARVPRPARDGAAQGRRPADPRPRTPATRRGRHCSSGRGRGRGETSTGTASSSRCASPAPPGRPPLCSAGGAAFAIVADSALPVSRRVTVVDAGRAGEKVSTRSAGPPWPLRRGTADDALAGARNRRRRRAGHTGGNGRRGRSVAARLERRPRGCDRGGRRHRSAPDRLPAGGGGGRTCGRSTVSACWSPRRCSGYRWWIGDEPEADAMRLALEQALAGTPLH